MQWASFTSKKSEALTEYYPYLNCGISYKTYDDYVDKGLIIHNDGYDSPIYENSKWLWKNKVNNDMGMQLNYFDNPENSEKSGYSHLRKAFVTDGINDYFSMLMSTSEEIELINGSTFSVTLKYNDDLAKNYTYFPYIKYSGGSGHLGWGPRKTFIFYGGGKDNVFSQKGDIIIKNEGYNVTFVQNADYSKAVFLNGKLVASSSVAGYTATALKFYYVAYNIQIKLNANYYNIKVYDRPLSSEEIEKNYLIDKNRFGI